MNDKIAGENINTRTDEIRLVFENNLSLFVYALFNSGINYLLREINPINNQYCEQIHRRLNTARVFRIVQEFYFEKQHVRNYSTRIGIVSWQDTFGFTPKPVGFSIDRKNEPKKN